MNLPDAPLSGPLFFATYLRCLVIARSHKKPDKIFDLFDRSPLAWDERIYLPMIGLKGLLVLFGDVDHEQAMLRVEFIVAERPSQYEAARAAAMEIAARDFESRHQIVDIANAYRSARKLLPVSAWQGTLAPFLSASLDCQKYCTAPRWQHKRAAMKMMVDELSVRYVAELPRHVAPTTARRLARVAKMWRQVAVNEIEALDNSPQAVNILQNPYVAGPPLRLGDSSFVGRQDVARRLEQALSDGKMSGYLPAFVLNGERRFGKTSAIRQLPNLLGSRFLSVSLDMQRPSVSLDVASFFSALEREVSEAMTVHGLHANLTSKAALANVREQGNISLFHAVDEWIEGVESALARDDFILLVNIDEYEKLDEAAVLRGFDLNILLDWFRSVIQQRTRVSVLFSGVKSLGELQADWTGHFVNAETVKLGLLNPGEVRQLILHPATDFPGSEVYSDEAVDKIIGNTGGHPFLTQAVCSRLIRNLNADSRRSAVLKDVDAAIESTLVDFSDYFEDLWRRTGPEERACLVTLSRYGVSDVETIARRSGFRDHAPMRVLANLERRDLIAVGTRAISVGGPVLDFEITVPMFGRWVTTHARTHWTAELR